MGERVSSGTGMREMETMRQPSAGSRPVVSVSRAKAGMDSPGSAGGIAGDSARARVAFIGGGRRRQKGMPSSAVSGWGRRGLVVGTGGGIARKGGGVDAGLLTGFLLRGVLLAVVAGPGRRGSGGRGARGGGAVEGVGVGALRPVPLVLVPVPLVAVVVGGVSGLRGGRRVPGGGAADDLVDRVSAGVAPAVGREALEFLAGGYLDVADGRPGVVGLAVGKDGDLVAGAEGDDALGAVLVGVHGAAEKGAAGVEGLLPEPGEADAVGAGTVALLVVAGAVPAAVGIVRIGAARSAGVRGRGRKGDRSFSKVSCCGSVGP